MTPTEVTKSLVFAMIQWTIYIFKSQFSEKVTLLLSSDYKFSFLFVDIDN